MRARRGERLACAVNAHVHGWGVSSPAAGGGWRADQSKGRDRARERRRTLITIVCTATRAAILPGAGAGGCPPRRRGLRPDPRAAPGAPPPRQRAPRGARRPGGRARREPRSSRAPRLVLARPGARGRPPGARRRSASVRCSSASARSAARPPASAVACARGVGHDLLAVPARPRVRSRSRARSRSMRRSAPRRRFDDDHADDRDGER